jgi:predicted membrane-bound dolichyl-phosphate-mannose-protein mannosyltransferase
VDVEVKRTLSRFYHWEYFWLCIILVATLAMHFSIILSPNQVVLDETHYVNDARSIIESNTDPRFEHPPLAKLFIVAGIEIFGDNQYGWRVLPIIMGTIGIVLFFFICRKLSMSRRAVNIATFLLAFENMTFLQASMAMLDVFFLTLTLAFFLLYLYRSYVLSGIFIGLAALAKLFAAMATPVLLIHWIFTRTKQTKWFILTVILAPVSFLALMPLFDFAITHQFKNPIVRLGEMQGGLSQLTFANTTHPALSRPWEWLLNYNPMAYWFGPIANANWVGGYTGAISPALWGVIIPVVLYMLYRTIKQRNEAALFGFAWFFSTFLLWIPISIATNRISFVYYFYPTIGAICIGLGMGFNELIEWVSSKSHKVKIPVVAGISAFFVAHIATVIILTPLVLFLLNKSI